RTPPPRGAPGPAAAPDPPVHAATQQGAGRLGSAREAGAGGPGPVGAGPPAALRPDPAAGAAEAAAPGRGHGQQSFRGVPVIDAAEDAGAGPRDRGRGAP